MQAARADPNPNPNPNPNPSPNPNPHPNPNQAAALHVAWASQGDACRGLAAARGTLALANATLADAQVRDAR